MTNVVGDAATAERYQNRSDEVCSSESTASVTGRSTSHWLWPDAVKSVKCIRDRWIPKSRKPLQVALCFLTDM